MPELLTRERRVPIVGVDAEARRVTVQLFRYNDPREVRDPGGQVYREAYAVDALELADDMHVAAVHHGPIVGRVDADTFDPSGEGPTVDLILSRSSAGSDVLADVEAGVIRAVSVEVEPLAELERDGVTIRTRARLHGVAFAFRPAHDAPILATREHDPRTTNPGGNMTETATPTAEAVPSDPAAIPGVTVETLNRSLDELRDDLTRTFIAERGETPEASALQFRSLGHYAEAVYADPANPILRRALADQVPANNPGVIPPGWLRDVAGIVDRGAPAITAFGRAPLPAEGMDVNWPYFDGDITALVGAQATPKTAITSVQVDLKKGSSNIGTYAGGSDIAYQLIRRSGPAYLAAYLRLMAIGYTATTDAAMASAVSTAAQASGATWDPATGTEAELASAVFQASVEVQAATGMPAGFILAGTSVFVAAGALSVQFGTTSYGIQNQGATADAGTLRVSVAGIPMIHDPYLTATDFIVSNTEAATWHGEGPFTVTAEDVERLGQNVAVWGMGAPAVAVPNGVRKIAAA